MNAKITFFTNPMSRGRVARWMLEECGATYETVLLDYGTTMKAADYLAINPMGKVPALKHGDAVVTELAAVCMYLADLFADKKLAPPVGSPERAAYYRWFFFLAGPLQEAMDVKALGAAVPPEMRGRLGFGSEQQVLDVLEAAVKKGPFLCGEHFTAVDLYASSNLGWMMGMKAIEPRPAFVDYVKRCSDRPAKLRAEEIDGKMG
jgi:glutathione S-transferase